MNSAEMDSTSTDSTSTDFGAFLRQALPPLGLDPKPHNRRSLRRRLAKRLEALGLRDWARYAARLEADPAERDWLAAHASVTISRFWRNRGLWEHLAGHVLPQLCRGGAGARARAKVRAWSAGCASGEEPYSLAMLWREGCPQHPLDLLATDLDRVVLERAGQGLYPAGSLHELPIELRERWFRPEGTEFRLSEELRRAVAFRRHDLLRDPAPEGPFGLILCRNVAFTYFAPEARANVARRLAAALIPGGWLAIGRKERLPMERLPVGAEGLEEAGYPGLFRKPPAV